jgi:uncharacterized protein (DUF433 family)
MTEQQLLERISVDSRVMVGKPVIAGTRLTVAYILGLLAHGATPEQILTDYEHLTLEDIQACFLYASKLLGTTSCLRSIAEPLNARERHQQPNHQSYCI